MLLFIQGVFFTGSALKVWNWFHPIKKLTGSAIKVLSMEEKKITGSAQHIENGCSLLQANWLNKNIP